METISPLEAQAQDLDELLELIREQIHELENERNLKKDKTMVNEIPHINPPAFYDLYADVIRDQVRTPDRHQWPPKSFRQKLLDLRGRLFGARLRYAPGSAMIPGGLKAFFGGKKGWPHDVHEDAVGWFKRRRLCRMAEFQPDTAERKE